MSKDFIDPFTPKCVLPRQTVTWTVHVLKKRIEFEFGDLPV